MMNPPVPYSAYPSKFQWSSLGSKDQVLHIGPNKQSTWIRFENDATEQPRRKVLGWKLSQVVFRNVS